MPTVPTKRLQNDPDSEIATDIEDITDHVVFNDMLQPTDGGGATTV